MQWQLRSPLVLLALRIPAGEVVKVSKAAALDTAHKAHSLKGMKPVIVWLNIYVWYAWLTKHFRQFGSCVLSKNKP